MVFDGSVLSSDKPLHESMMDKMHDDDIYHMMFL